MVVDNQAGVPPLDQELAQLLRATGKPFVIAVNKVDALGQEAHAAEFHSLGASIFPIAAEHGTGVDDLLDYALHLTAEEQAKEATDSGRLPVEMGAAVQLRYEDLKGAASAHSEAEGKE